MFVITNILNYKVLRSSRNHLYQLACGYMIAVSKYRCNSAIGLGNTTGR